MLLVSAHDKMHGNFFGICAACAERHPRLYAGRKFALQVEERSVMLPQSVRPMKAAALQSSAAIVKAKGISMRVGTCISRRSRSAQVENIGVQIEQPFEVLPLPHFCAAIKKHVLDMVSIHAEGQGAGQAGVADDAFRHDPIYEPIPQPDGEPSLAVCP